MITRALILRLFDAASMQRWNDKIRPVELTELDKQAHKMVIAYLFGKIEEGTKNFSWIDIIEGGLFEFLQRLVITDLKPQIFYQIKRDKKKYRQLNEWVFNKLAPVISPLGSNFCDRFRSYFVSENTSLNRKILHAAHFYATKWEFDIIERHNPQDYEINTIREELNSELERNYDLKGIKEVTLYPNFRKFIDLCGLLRFQIRWSHLYRVPKISVLGHMLIVAILAYLFSLETGACARRRINNYFTGLFHDLPEVLTRDISSPVKNSIEGLDEMIKEYEKEQMKKEVYRLIPRKWRQEMQMFTEYEFKNVVTLDGRVAEKTSFEINNQFNCDEYNPRDGEIIKVVDDLTAFVEAYLAVQNGIEKQEFIEAQHSLKDKYASKSIAGIKLGEIYAEF